MPDETLPGFAGWVAARLPPEVADRCFVPACCDLKAEYLSNGRAARRHCLWDTTTFTARMLAVTVECAWMALMDAWRRRVRERRGSPRAGTGAGFMVMQDVRFALRMLRKNPAFTIVASLALALGIGANTAIFSVVHAVLLRPLPYPDASRIVQLSETARGQLMTISPPNLVDWIAQNHTFDAVAPYAEARTTLTGGFEPEELQAATVGADVFKVLGVAPLMGRTMVPAEERPGGPRSVVLGYNLWRQRFGGDRGILGRALTFDGQSYEVVGVMPRGFSFPEGIELWLPLVLTQSDLRPSQRGAHYLLAIGRLEAGVTVKQAFDDLAAIEQRIARQHSSVEGYGVWVQPLIDSMVGSVRRPLLLLLGAVGFVLLIACVNVSNLLLARATTRRAEIAVRSALGAGRWRIVRQLLAESVVLALTGGLLGVLLAAWGVLALDAVLPQDLPRAHGITVNTSVLLFSIAISITTGIVFGVVPALYAATPDVAAFLKDARRDGAGAGRRRVRSALVAAEVALSLVLLAGAGLAMRSFDRLNRIEPGFDRSGLAAISVMIPAARYPDAPSLARFYRNYVEALAAQPGVVSAGAVMIPPLARAGFGGTLSLAGRDAADEVRAQVRAATHGYFETLRIPLRRGRFFRSADREGATPVAIVSETAAREFWPAQDAIGQRLRLHVGVYGKEIEREVVGVVGDVRLKEIEATPPPAVYTPHAQYTSDRMTIFVRTNGDPMALLPVVKAQLAILDRELAISRVRTGEQLVAASIAQPRFRMLLLTVFAAIALALACVGLYGVMAFSVSQRTAELGLRMALGADRANVMRLVLIQGLLPVGIGIGVGLAGAGVLTQAMAGLLYGVSAFDPLTFAAVAVLLAVVASAAIYVPARRATTVDPLVALREP